MQHAVDAEADRAEVTLGFEVDIGSTLFECVLPEPVDDVDDVLVIRIDLLVITELDQLLEVVA